MCRFHLHFFHNEAVALIEHFALLRHGRYSKIVLNNLIFCKNHFKINPRPLFGAENMSRKKRCEMFHYRGYFLYFFLHQNYRIFSHQFFYTKNCTFFTSKFTLKILIFLHQILKFLPVGNI